MADEGEEAEAGIEGIAASTRAGWPGAGRSSGARAPAGNKGGQPPPSGSSPSSVRGDGLAEREAGTCMVCTG